MPKPKNKTKKEEKYTDATGRAKSAQDTRFILKQGGPKFMVHWNGR